MKTKTAKRPTIIARWPWAMESSPREAPIACWLATLKERGRAAVLSNVAKFWASTASNPDMRTDSRMGSWIVA